MAATLTLTLTLSPRGEGTGSARFRFSDWLTGQSSRAISENAGDMKALSLGLGVEDV